MPKVTHLRWAVKARDKRDKPIKWETTTGYFARIWKEGGAFYGSLRLPNTTVMFTTARYDLDQMRGAIQRRIYQHEAIRR